MCRWKIYINLSKRVEWSWRVEYARKEILDRDMNILLYYFCAFGFLALNISFSLEPAIVIHLSNNSK
jgi:hypothetical protein